MQINFGRFIATPQIIDNPAYVGRFNPKTLGVALGYADTPKGRDKELYTVYGEGETLHTRSRVLIADQYHQTSISVKDRLVTVSDKDFPSEPYYTMQFPLASDGEEQKIPSSLTLSEEAESWPTRKKLLPRLRTRIEDGLAMAKIVNPQQ